MGFFNRYDRFYATSKINVQEARLNGRYDAIIARNMELLKDKRVLDIASHDGRWTFAALKAGASHVTGVEPRQELINNAISTFTHYGIRDGFTFWQGDIFDYLKREKRTFDVVICLGFFYHTSRHVELLDLIERTGAEHIILDTSTMPLSEEKPAPPNSFGEIRLRLESVEGSGNACFDSLSRGGKALVGYPLRTAIHLLAKHFGYTCDMFDWPTYLKKLTVVSGCKDYIERQRETFYLTRKSVL